MICLSTCQWYLVFLTLVWYSVTFRLEGNALKGGIPSEIGNLSNLGTHVLRGCVWLYLRVGFGWPCVDWFDVALLYLFENVLLGSIPSEVGRSTNLGRYHGTSNRISLSCLALLKSVLSVDCRFRGACPFRQQLDWDNSYRTGPLSRSRWARVWIFLHNCLDNMLMLIIVWNPPRILISEILYLRGNSLNGTIPIELTELSKLSKSFHSMEDMAALRYSCHSLLSSESSSLCWRKQSHRKYPDGDWSADKLG